MKSLFPLMLILLILLAGPVVLAQSVHLYVAPGGSDAAPGTTPQQALATLQKAKEKVRLRKESQPADTIYVHLGTGEYAFTEPLLFGPEDGGTAEAPVIYQGEGNGGTVWHGGRKITGWKRHRGNIWYADLPEAKGGNWKIAQLYAGGESRPRARLPKSGFYRVAGFPDGNLDVGYQTPSRRFEYRAGDINPAWKNLRDVEVVVYHFWTDTHLSIDSVHARERIVTFRHPSGKVFTDDFNNIGARYMVENVWEGLTEPGEWYLDKGEGRVYYIPLPGEDMKTLALWAPRTPALVRLTGKAAERDWVSGIRFRGITFQYAHAPLPPGNTNNGQASVSVPAAVTLEGARHIAFEGCTFRNLEGYAFDIREGSADNHFAHNTITHIGGGGFKVNGAKAGEAPLLQTYGNRITDNEIGPYGEIYRSAVGVLLMHTRNNEVAHNEIHHGYYTGVSVGWEWGYQRSLSRDNVIAYNHIHHIGQGLLSDMGGVYTLGVSPGTVVRNNLIHHVDAHNYGGWGIYNDEGSAHILVEHNIVYHTKFAGYNIHYAKEVTVRNNIFAFGRLQQLNRTRAEPHQSVFFENNIVYWTEGVLLDDNWQDKPYDFYVHPNPKSGTRKMTSTFQMDYNLYYNPSRPLDSIAFNKLSWKEWQAAGRDQHSLFADPLFVDAARYDFRLKEGSPALRLGFRSIDLRTVGPRKREL